MVQRQVEVPHHLGHHQLLHQPRHGAGQVQPPLRRPHQLDQVNIPSSKQTTISKVPTKSSPRSFSLYHFSRKEMRHEALLMAEFVRLEHHAAIGGTLLVSRRLVNITKINEVAGSSNALSGTPSFVWHPDRDAMFKVSTFPPSPLFSLFLILFFSDHQGRCFPRRLQDG